MILHHLKPVPSSVGRVLLAAIDTCTTMEAAEEHLLAQLDLGAWVIDGQPDRIAVYSITDIDGPVAVIQR